MERGKVEKVPAVSLLGYCSRPRTSLSSARSSLPRSKFFPLSYLFPLSGRHSCKQKILAMSFFVVVVKVVVGHAANVRKPILLLQDCATVEATVTNRKKFLLIYWSAFYTKPIYDWVPKLTEKKTNATVVPSMIHKIVNKVIIK